MRIVRFNVMQNRLVKNTDMVLYVVYSPDGSEMPGYPIVTIKDVSASFFTECEFPVNLEVDFYDYDELYNKYEGSTMFLKLLPDELKTFIWQNLNKIIFTNYISSLNEEPNSDEKVYYDLVAREILDLKDSSQSVFLEVSTDYASEKPLELRKYIDFYSRYAKANHAPFYILVKTRAVDLGVVHHIKAHKRNCIYTDRLMGISTKMNLGASFTRKNFLFFPYNRGFGSSISKGYKKSILERDIGYFLDRYSNIFEEFKKDRIKKVNEKAFDMLSKEGIFLLNVTKGEDNKLNLENYKRAIAVYLENNMSPVYKTDWYTIKDYSPKKFSSEKLHLMLKPNFCSDFFSQPILNGKRNINEEKTFPYEFLRYSASRADVLTKTELELFDKFNESVNTLAEILSQDVHEILFSDTIFFT